MTAISPRIGTRRDSAASVMPNERSVAHRSTPAVLRIDRVAVQKNYATMRAQTAAAVRHGAVLKSDAYGLGARPIAEALVEAGCSLFFVADLDAALALRAALPKVAIVALDGYSQQRASDYRDHGIVAVANDLHDIEALRQDASPLPYILNVDTGLNRRGLEPRAATCLYLEGLFDRLRPTGLMSHLACAAAADHPMNDLQLQRFQQLYALMRPAWGSLAASCGVWLGRRFHFDVTRLGSALFGLDDRRMRPSPLQPVLNLSAQVVEVRALDVGEAVGYGATFRAARPTRLAVVGMGYAQGLPRTDRGLTARIGAFAVPAVGWLSMEWLTLDVTDVPEPLCHRGTWVSLLDAQTTIDDLADATGIAAQEILLRLGASCGREHTALEARAASFEPTVAQVASNAPYPIPVRRDR